MQITTTTREGRLELKIRGRMDASWSDHVARALAESVQSGQHQISLDMAEVVYLSSAGIRILVIYARKLKSIQGSFVIINPSIQVRNVLELSGLGTLLLATEVAPSEQLKMTASGSVALSESGAMAEVFELDRQAGLRVQWPGSPEPWLKGAASSEKGLMLDFPVEAMGIGLGGFGSGQGGEEPCFGEFLAAAGAVVCLPTDESHSPDYMLQEGRLIPSLKIAYGMVGSGGFRRLVRFDKGQREQGLPFSSVVRACLQANGNGPMGLVMVAEAASLTGVALQKNPAAVESATRFENPFTFPDVREWLSFTTEPAFLNTTSLIVGFAAPQAAAGGLRLVKPLVPSGEIQGHFHAAAFPYQPLRKGKIELEQTVRPLFENGQVLGLLHLLNDWREINGAGESRLLRGACWCSPLIT